MSWDIHNYPDSMKNLQGPIKQKAIDIANRLLEEDYEEGRAIAQAEKWAGADDSPPPQHVVPHPKGWAIRAEHARKASFIFHTKEKALKKARAIAKNQETILIIHRQDGAIERQQNFSR